MLIFTSYCIFQCCPHKLLLTLWMYLQLPSFSLFLNKQHFYLCSLNDSWHKKTNLSNKMQIHRIDTAAFILKICLANTKILLNVCTNECPRDELTKLRRAKPTHSLSGVIKINPNHGSLPTQS